MILSLIFGFIVGIFVGSFFFPGLGFVIRGGLFWIFDFRLFFFRGKGTTSCRFFSFQFFFSVRCLVWSRMNFSDNYRDSTLTQFENKKTEFVGIVADEPDVREKATMLTVLLQSAKVGTTTVPLNEKIIVSTQFVSAV